MNDRMFRYRPVNWVVTKKAAELTGRTEDSLNHLVASGRLVEGVHWKWSPDNRRHFSLSALDEWVHSRKKSTPLSHWVFIDEAADLIGRPGAAVAKLAEAGVLVEGKHWKWDAEYRRIFNLKELDAWIETGPNRGRRRPG